MNPAAVILSEVFVSDLTTVQATCANGATMTSMGALPVYAHGMGRTTADDIGNASTPDYGVAAFNRTERHKGKTIIRVRP